MKHPERVEDYLDHIAQAIRRATEYVEGVGSLAAFEKSQRDQDAVIRNIEVIGEAASRIQREAPDFTAAHPELPWIEMRGMRNKVIHNYFDVDLSVVWNTVKDDLPRLKQQIDHLMKEQEATREVAPPTGKDAKKAALAQMQTETEQSVQQGQEPKQRDRDR